MRPRWPSSSRSSFQSIRSEHAIVPYHRGLTLNAELLDGRLGVWKGFTGEPSPRVTGPTGYSSSAICIRSIGLENRSTGRPLSTAIRENRRSCGLPSTRGVYPYTLVAQMRHSKNWGGKLLGPWGEANNFDVA